MEEKNTDLLLQVLRSADPEDLNSYEENCISSGPGGFCRYMDRLIAEKQLKRQDIFQKADLPRKYGYKLLTGECHTTSRDKLLRLFFAMGLTLEEAQRALTLYGMPILYAKFRRDAVLIVAFSRGITDVDLVSTWLEDRGEPPLEGSSD